LKLEINKYQKPHLSFLFYKLKLLQKNGFPDVRWVSDGFLYLSMKTFPFILSLFCCAHLSLQSSFGFAVKEYAVRITPSIVSGPKIRLDWDDPTSTGTYQVSRLEGGAWIVKQTSAAHFFEDSDVSSGSRYEYQVKKTESGRPDGYGYVSTGLAATPFENRGKVVLLVDSTFAGALDLKITRLISDLRGDGYSVIRYNILRTTSPKNVRNQVDIAYKADPSNVRAVFILGHVPVAYSGNHAADGHWDTHMGAWPADVYYGYVTNSTIADPWTDSTVNKSDAYDPRNNNIPGDGKFDQDYTPFSSNNPVALLPVGRVDFYNLPAFQSASPSRDEVALLSNYLDKDHNYRQGLIPALQKRALIADRDYDDKDPSWAPAAMGLRDFTSIYGQSGVSFYDQFTTPKFSEIFSKLKTDDYQFVQVASTTGDPSYIDEFCTNNDPSTSDLKVNFLGLLASFIGDWDSTTVNGVTSNPNNILRGFLASPTHVLATFWSGKPLWFTHHMASGYSIGYSTAITQSNPDSTGLYKAMNLGRGFFVDNLHVATVAGMSHIALMGDPTLRLHVVRPPRDPAKSVSGGLVTVTWAASLDDVPNTGFKGYHVYRSTYTWGSWTRLTTTPTTGLSFQEPVPTGAFTYMIRAARVEGWNNTLSLGTYTNLSQGAFTPNYSIAPLTPLVGGTYTIGYGINARGDMAGKGDTGTGATHAFWSTAPSSDNDIDSMTSNSGALAISDNWWLTGYAWDTYMACFRPFKYEGYGTDIKWTWLNRAVNGGNYTEGNAVNNSGDIAGYGDISGVNRALLWISGSINPTDLGTLGGMGSTLPSYAYGINSNGKVVGTAYKSPGVMRAFRTAARTVINTGTDDLGTISGVAYPGHSSEANAINDLDDVAGGSHISNGQYHAFFKSGTSAPNSGFTDLGTLGSGIWSVGYGINSSGFVAGSARMTTASGSEHAFVWNKEWSKMQDLNTAIPPNGGWILQEAFAINNVGQITGYGTLNGVRRGFLLTPN
jgi:probable HAF family extracellular repeat protein